MVQHYMQHCPLPKHNTLFLRTCGDVGVRSVAEPTKIPMLLLCLHDGLRRAHDLSALKI
jgi:hypothetical protein